MKFQHIVIFLVHNQLFSIFKSSRNSIYFDLTFVYDCELELSSFSLNNSASRMEWIISLSEYSY